MRILVAGVDGYLGWALAQHLTQRGHTVAGADNYLRRDWVAELGSQSATPIRRMTERIEAFRENFGKNLQFFRGDLADHDLVMNIFRHFRPEAIVHLGEMPSAPYSMIDAGHAIFTHKNNLFGTLNILFAMRDVCPESHLVKLGTMGEYGTPDVDIPEGFFTIEYRGRTDTLPFPRQANSWYHQTKVHDSNNVMMACRLWKLRSTDIMQGVVYGTRIDAMGDDERLLTRFDFDQCFGTAINRFCAQAAIGAPLTLYGQGGQKRGFIPLRDSVQCLTIAVENPPKGGEYRVFNQFEHVYNVTELAAKVKKAGDEIGLNVQIRNVENPRQEQEQHYYNPDHKHLLKLGYRPTRDMLGELRIMLKDLTICRGRIEARREALFPDIRWDGSRRPVEYLDEPVTEIEPTVQVPFRALARKQS
ncbi:MAG: NAD-dependent epimerase/dehydratase family protein [Desulfomonile tiedjei]|uniref:NAD-dependent epimerase/dehydratase family protein n=1 Tax=Desulfomonile tiedjei TaxID=2358 RepID=A0A9D6Z5E9_9BACT|nr:NAD-dependent epimerase/dehydratase family protein [Desulfomonile tiedjei]